MHINDRINVITGLVPTARSMAETIDYLLQNSKLGTGEQVRIQQLAHVWREQVEKAAKVIRGGNVHG